MAQIGQKPSWWSLPGKQPLLQPDGGADVLFLLHLCLWNRGNFLSFPFSFLTSPTQFQRRILKPIYSGFVESSNFAPSKISFPFKRGLQRRMFWSIFSSSAGLRFCDLWYSPEPLLFLETRCSSCTSAASEIVSYEEPVTLLKSLVEAYEDTGEVPACYALPRVKCPIPSSLLGIIHSGIVMVLTGK